MTKILVPLDGSDLSEAALPVADGMATAMDAEIVLLHVTELPETTAQREEARRVALARLNELSPLLRQPNRCLVEQTGDPVEGILRAVEDERPDIIIMSTHDRTGVSSFTEGSIAERVMQKTSVPVTLVKPKSK
jgi:nucleotide-binding universal stress UspA family protein